MNTLEAIEQRRSIRKFRDTPIPDEVVEKIIHAATLAPSGKNRQPWRFIVVRQDKRADMVRAMREGIARFRERGVGPGSSEWTAKVMEQAPVTVFVFNDGAEYAQMPRDIGGFFMNSVDVQSIGAAIQNMLLAALDMGVGSLWICDVLYAYEELCNWLGQTHQMIAAVSFGYPDEQPKARPRKSVGEVTEWR
jgi:F420 biosynthesis protein FbiB-like protein